MENKITKFIISKKDGKIIYHKTELLNRLFAIQNGIDFETFVKNGRFSVIDGNLFAFGTSLFVNETLKGLIYHTIRKTNTRKDRLKIYVTPEFIKINNQAKLSATLKEFPEIEVKKLNFSEVELDKAINEIIKNNKPQWRNIAKLQKEITYIDLGANLKYFDFFLNNI